MWVLVCQAVIPVLIIKLSIISSLLIVKRGWFWLLKNEQLHSLVTIEYKHLGQVKNVVMRSLQDWIVIFRLTSGANNGDTG